MYTARINLAYKSTVPVPVVLRNDGAGVDLAGATITLTVVWMGEDLGVSYDLLTPTSYAPGSTVAIEDFACTPDADQTNNKGKLTFTPTTAFYAAAPPGWWRYQFMVTFGSGAIEFYPRLVEELSECLLRVHPTLRNIN